MIQPVKKYSGVSYIPRRNKFVAQCNLKGCKLYEYFDCPKEACRRYWDFKINHLEELRYKELIC